MFCDIFRKKGLTAAREALYVDDKNKALARYLIRNRIGNLDGEGISANSDKHVHLILAGFSPLLLQIGRQVCFNSHFPNFDETNGKNRTRITFIIEQGQMPCAEVEFPEEMAKTFGNLPQYCKWTIRNEVKGLTLENKHYLPFLDIEFNIIIVADNATASFLNKEAVSEEDLVTLITQKDLEVASANCFHRCVDLSRIAKDISDETLLIPVEAPMMVNWVYEVSKGFNTINLRVQGNPKEYLPFVRKYARKRRNQRIHSEWSRLSYESKLSNLYCSDSYEYRLRSIGCSPAAGKREMERRVLENIEDLSRTEHARWNVEKLLLGFRPYSEEDMWHDENLAGRGQQAARALMKKKRTHINICSWARLNRITPEAIQYDSFLMLAMPTIIKEAQNNADR